jgi:CRP-like cAMP-binding protein
MKSQGLGRLYKDGECILYEGDPADFLFVVQEGSVELAYDEPDRTTRLVMLETGDVFGESALFSRAPRTTHARAVGSARVLTLDRQVLLRRLRQDTLLALELLRSMSERVQALERVVKDLRAQTPAGSNGSARRS